MKEGRDTDEIAATFGITPRMVIQRLVLRRLHPPILWLDFDEEVQAPNFGKEYVMLEKARLGCGMDGAGGPMHIPMQT